MKFVCLTILITFFLSALTLAQGKKSSVCAGSSKDSSALKNVILTVCGHESGMAPLIQPRLYLRLFSDGRAEYETTTEYDEPAGDASDGLLLQEMNVDKQDVEAIGKFVRQSDFLNSNAEYPIFQRWTDSSLKLIIIVSTEGREKRIVVNNFTDSDKDNKSHYPASLLALLEKKSELNVKKWAEIAAIRAKNTASKKGAPEIVEYQGWLEEGKTYRAIVYSDKRRVWSLAVPLKIPFHHAARIEWKNQDKFFMSKENHIVFRVISKEVKRIGRSRWNTTYSCEISNVESLKQ